MLGQLLVLGGFLSATLFSATAAAAIAGSSGSGVSTIGKSAKSDKSSAVLERFELEDHSLNAQQEFELANEALNKAVTGKKPEEISTAEIADVIRRAERAAKRGSAAAYNLLYTVYFSGWGVSADNIKAIGYLERAAEMGDLGAKLNYAILLYQGVPQVERNAMKACGYFKELITDARVATVASYFMGLIEFNGECGAPANEKHGMELIQIAADSGMGEAEMAVALNHEKGWTAPADLKTALSWYEKAAEHGQPRAAWRVGMAYENGEFRERDAAKAIEYFQIAATGGDANGFASMAAKYLSGEGVERHLTKAKYYFQQAAAQGHADASIELAKIYLHGVGTDVDVVQARVLYTRGVELGATEQPTLLQSIEANMSPAQMHTARELIAKLLAP